MPNLKPYWPLSLHTAHEFEKVWPNRSEHLAVLCKRLPIFFCRESLLTAVTFALSRDGGTQYVELLLKVAQKRLPSLSTNPTELIKKLMNCELTEYQLINRVFIEASESIRFTSASYSDKESFDA